MRSRTRAFCAHLSAISDNPPPPLFPVLSTYAFFLFFFVGFEGKGILRFVGLHPEKQKPRLGIELLNEGLGKHNGTTGGFKYFKCPKKQGVIVAKSKVTFVAGGGNADADADAGAGAEGAGEFGFGDNDEEEDFGGFGDAPDEEEETVDPLPEGGEPQKKRKSSFFGGGSTMKSSTSSSSMGSKGNTMSSKDLKKALKAEAQEAKKREKDAKKALAAAKKAHKKSKKSKGVTLAEDVGLEPLKIATVVGKARLTLPLPKPLENLQSILVERSGSRMMRHQPKKTAVMEVLMFDSSTHQVVMKSPKVKGDTYIPLTEIREIRYGPGVIDTKGFTLSSDFVHIDPDLAFVIMYGTHFHLHQMCYCAETQEQFEAWTVGLERLLPESSPELYTDDLNLQRWLTATYRETSLSDGEPGVSLKDMKVIMRAFSVKTDNKTTKDMFDRISQGEPIFEFDGFVDMYRAYTNSPAFNAQFGHIADAKGSVKARTMSEFFNKVGMSDMSAARCKDVVARFTGKDGKFSLLNLMYFLHSKENDIGNPKYHDFHQDMSKPLAHYFISSSHNTYLLGDQFKSESSIEAYISPLRENCRCVEIDTWDGPNQQPIVYHGYTLTSKILFTEVIRACYHHMFWQSLYPVIISSENHCNVQQQEVMATVLKSYFGDALVSHPIPGSSAHAYPSPDQLKGRIIFKHKKLAAGQTEIELKDKKSEDLSESLMNGYLMVEDEVDGKWQSHYFVMTDELLFFSEPQDPDVEDESDVHHHSQAIDSMELHEREAWFHGTVEGGRSVANKRIKTYVVANLLPEETPASGAFLIRASDRTPGEFSLGFWIQDTQSVQNVSIKISESGKYFMLPQVQFDNIFQLVEYYKIEPLKGPFGEQILTFPVPQPPDYLDEPWYKGKLTRSEAEDLVGRISADGCFLVRESDKGSADAKFAVTFKAEGKTKHCRIIKDGPTYAMGDAEFKSLNSLVNNYSKQALYRKVKLRYPITDSLLSRNASHGGPADEEELYTSQDLYATPDSIAQGAATQRSIACKTLYAYKAKNDDELSFAKGVVILNVVQGDSAWWRGDYNKGVCLRFPSNYAEVIQMERMGEGEKSDGDNILGDLEQGRFSMKSLELTKVPGIAEYPNMAMFQGDAGSTPLKVAARDETDLRLWMDALSHAKETAAQSKKRGSNKGKEGSKKHKTMKIAQTLSDLIYYVHSVSFSSFAKAKSNPYQTMSSFAESKAMGLASELGEQAMEWNKYNFRQVSRIYPAGKRVNSSNYDPQSLWNCGCQLVALNYQTGDLPMWLNRGKFDANGSSGFLEKPRALLQASFDPFVAKTYAEYTDTCFLKVKIVSGRHLVDIDSGLISPVVELSISGLETDNTKVRTAEIESNGLNPSFGEEYEFQVTMPEMACLGITVYNVDMFGDPAPIGQRFISIGSKMNPGLRPGYRSVQLRNKFGFPLELASVLLYLEVRYGTLDTDRQSKLEKMRHLCLERDKLVESVVANARQGKSNPADQRILSDLNSQIADIERTMESEM